MKYLAYYYTGELPYRLTGVMPYVVEGVDKQSAAEQACKLRYNSKPTDWIIKRFDNAHKKATT